LTPSPARKPSPRATLLALATLVALVLVPFLFWQGTWFGRTLSDRDLDKYLRDETKPRQMQHALVQISQRLERRDSSVSRWYPRVAELSRHTVAELRVTAAWLMGQDNREKTFHDALLAMLGDPEPAVRRNAALSLVRFSDAAGHGELAAMLRPFTLLAPRDGVLRYRLKVGDVVDHLTLIARLETGEQEPLEVRSPLPGKFEAKIAAEGAPVRAGEELLRLGPSADHVWESLRALYLVGAAEDLPEVEKLTRPVPQWSQQIAEQASLTARQIRARAAR